LQGVQIAAVDGPFDILGPAEHGAAGAYQLHDRHEVRRIEWGACCSFGVELDESHLVPARLTVRRDQLGHPFGRHMLQEVGRVAIKDPTVRFDGAVHQSLVESPHRFDDHPLGVSRIHTEGDPGAVSDHQFLDDDRDRAGLDVQLKLLAVEECPVRP
jgi:hypothetical protein